MSDSGDDIAKLSAELEELRQRNRELEESLETLQAQHSRIVEATEHCTDGFVLFDEEDRFVLCNDTYRSAMDDVSDILVPGTTFEEFLRIRADRNLRTDGVKRDEAMIQQRLEAHRNPKEPIIREFEDGKIFRLQEFRIGGGYTVLIRSEITAEREAEERTQDLRDSEEMFRGAIASLQEGFALFDADDRLVLFNDRYQGFRPELADLLKPGVKFETLLRAVVAAGNVPLADGREEEFIQERLNGRNNLPVQIVRELRDGRCFLVEERRTPDGGLVTTQTDISDSRRAERILAAAVESIPDGLALWDPDDRLIYYNKNYVKDRPGLGKITKLGMTFEEFTRAREAKNLRASRTHGNERLTVEERLERHRNPKEPFLSPFEDGRVMRVNEVVTADGYVAVIRTDITDLVNAERALRDANDQFGAFIENCPASITLKDTEGRFLLVNKMWHQWHDNAPENVIGATNAVALTKEHQNVAEALEDEVIQTGKTAESEVSQTQLDGTEIHGLVQKFPIFDKDGNVEKIGTLRTDISRRKEAEENLRIAMEEARLANESKSIFLANMSHELRTPLNAILGFSEILSGEMFGALGSAKYVEYSKDIFDSSQHLLNLINDILDLSAVESGKQLMNKERFDLNETVADCVSLITHSIESKKLVFDAEVPKDLPDIYVDRRALKQILINLLGNAVKFSKSGEQVSLKASYSDARHVISINNTGSYIPPAVVNKISEPFMRGDSAFDLAQEGSGLGLAIVRSLINLNTGKFEIESDVKKGVTVTVSFPDSD
ncbi:MAG: hypothetical protein CMM48_00155 [Rhodospirillaceae bacterium]|nr:hypothetical protein [Rhodospirillaceae bacterium]